MSNTIIQVRRTSTAGRTPNTTSSGNTQYINAGEFGLNMTDQILYTSNGTVLITVGSNQTFQSVTNTLYVGNTTTTNVVINSSALFLGNTGSNAVINSTGFFYNGTVVGGGSFSNGSAYTWTAVQTHNANIAMAGNATAELLIGSTGANVIANGTTIIVQANTTQNAVMNSSGFYVNGSVVGGGSFSNGTAYTWSAVETFNANVTIVGNATSVLTIGNATYNTFVNSTNFVIGNTTVNTIINSTVISTTGSLSVNGITSVNATSMTIGNTTSNATMNSTGIAIINATASTNLTLNGLSTSLGTIIAGSSNSFGVVSAGAGAGQFSGTGNIYFQVSIQNANTGNNSSGDFIAYADVANLTSGFIDVGINNTKYAQPGVFDICSNGDSYILAAAVNSTMGGALAIGTGNAQPIKFFTGNVLVANERLRIDPNGNVGIGTTSANSLLTVNGNIYASNGVTGVSVGSYGIQGFSNISTGVYGVSNTGIGVAGYSNAGSSAGVYGSVGTGSTGVGVSGVSVQGPGISGTSNTYFGVQGFSNTNIGVYAQSNSGQPLVAANATVTFLSVAANGFTTLTGLIPTGNVIITGNGTNEIVVGNATVNATINATGFYVNGSAVGGGSFSNGTAYTWSAVQTHNANIALVGNTTSGLIIGNTTTNVAINASTLFFNGTTSSLSIGSGSPVTINTSTLIIVANGSTNSILNATSLALSYSLTGTYAVVNTNIISIGNSVQNVQITSISGISLLGNGVFFTMSTVDGVTSNGTTLGTAYVVNSSITKVISNPASAGVVLYNPKGAGTIETIVNDDTANSCLVYPVSTTALDLGTASAPFTLLPSGRWTGIAVNSTAWSTISPDLQGTASQITVTRGPGIATFSLPASVAVTNSFISGNTTVNSYITGSVLNFANATNSTRLSVNSLTIGLANTANSIINATAHVSQNATSNVTITPAFVQIFNRTMQGLTAPTGTPVTGELQIQTSNVAGRAMVSTVANVGYTSLLQPHIGQKSVAWINPNPGVAAPTVLGIALTTTGTATLRAPASGNTFLSSRRTAAVTSAAVGNSAGFNGTVLNFWRGNAAGLGGFHFYCRFGISQRPDANVRFFVGMAGSVTALGNANPSAQTNIIGMGTETAGGGVLNIYQANATTCNIVSMGITDATSNSNIFEFAMYAPANGGTISWWFNSTSGSSNSGTFANTTTIPATTQFLTPVIWINTGASATAAAIDLHSMYIESDL